MERERLAEYDGLVAWKTATGTVALDYGDQSVPLAAGDRLEFSWGGPGPAAIGTTPFTLVLDSAGTRTVLYHVTLLDERDDDYRVTLDGLRALLAAVKSALPGITVVED